MSLVVLGNDPGVARRGPDRQRRPDRRAEAIPSARAPAAADPEAPDDATEAAARRTWDEEAAPRLDCLERTLGDREWFGGERISIADLAVARPFVNVRHAGYAPERKRWPRLRGFLERIRQRPSFAPLLAEELPIFGQRAERIRD